MGPYPRTSRGKQYLLVATDMFNRWTEACPLGTATTKTITETLEREFFSRYGYPRVCLSDNGPQFVANDMRNAIERWGAEGWTTPVYHPRANLVERRNQEIKKRSTRFTHQRIPPSVLVLGREGKRPGDWALSRTTADPIEHINREREKREKDVLDIPPITGGQTQPTFKTGDVVYYKAHDKFHAGFALKWWGPVRLHKRVGKGVFLTDQQPPRKIHVLCLKRAPTTTHPHSNTTTNR
ncbi:uncharacterized protein LOC132925287 [Rhopalosiphum padi]|uniref:uncharacterized protein LOC132925287 n=1 Tax=Rhopalosiphum padi TaxID=40932 RepID=UPI00298DEADE|nr:uncharacterized protein LOC132925287 [Rhopalosiphum padi]